MVRPLTMVLSVTKENLRIVQNPNQDGNTE